MERVRERTFDLREQLELVDGKRRLTALRARRPPAYADDVAEVDVHRSGALGLDQQLDAAGPVDEIEEDELSHVAPGHDAPGQSPGLSSLFTSFERLRLGPDRGDVDAVGKPLRQRAHSRASLVLAADALGRFDLEDLVLQGAARG